MLERLNKLWSEVALDSKAVVRFSTGNRVVFKFKIGDKDGVFFIGQNDNDHTTDEQMKELLRRKYAAQKAYLEQP